MTARVNCSIFLISIVSLLCGCEKQSEPANPQEAPYFRQIEKFRAAKDDHFATSKKSPLLKGDKESFQGLKYFPIDPAFRFTLQLHKYDRPDTIEIMTTDGYDRPALRYGYFEFDAVGRRNTLQVYKFLDTGENYKSSLFLPFLDQTAGEKTYGGGRYIDLVENREGIYELDFNLAYNPSCAYGRTEYRCPLPPSENALKISVTAGELAWLK